MSYFSVLLIFVGTPLLIFAALNYFDEKRSIPMPQSLNTWRPYTIIAWLVVVAVAYTTPWDNYLVATRVWWYDPDLVTGFVIGYVPIEEYTFFIVQTIMTGLFTTWLMRRMPIGDLPPTQAKSLHIRYRATGFTAVLWLASVVLLLLSFTGGVWEHGNYLALELSWALIPIMIQLIVGADILWRHRWTVITAILTTWLYLSAVDAIAIQSGTWTINPEKSLPILIGGILPIEEAIFFLITNVLVVFGLTLILERTSETRVPALLENWLRQQRQKRDLATGTGE